MSTRQRIPSPDGSAIVATRFADGVELDFPRPVAPTAGLQIGVVAAAVGLLGTAIPTLLSFGVAGVMGITTITFAVALGILFLAAATVLVLLLMNLWPFVPGNPSRDEAAGVMQLVVADGVLVRKDFRGGREVWHADEIADIRSENYWLGPDPFLGVVLRSPDEEPFILYGAVPFDKADDEQRAELDWVAAELRRALQLPDDPLKPAPPQTEPADEGRPSSQAIMEKSPHLRGDR